MKSLPSFLSLILIGSVSLVIANGQSATPIQGADSSTAVRNNIDSSKPASAQSTASAGQATVVSDRPAETTLAGSLNSGRTVSTIQTQELETRDRLISQLAQTVAHVDQKVAQLKSGAATLQGDPLANLNSAWSDYQKSKQRFDQALQNAKRASTAAAWDQARSALAAEYAFYVAAVAGVEVAVPNT